MRVRFVRSRGEVKLEEVKLRQLLNVLRQVKRLSDTSPAAALLCLHEQVKQLLVQAQLLLPANKSGLG